MYLIGIIKLHRKF